MSKQSKEPVNYDLYMNSRIGSFLESILKKLSVLHISATDTMFEHTGWGASEINRAREIFNNQKILIENLLKEHDYDTATQKIFKMYRDCSSTIDHCTREEYLRIDTDAYFF